jgi:hypothetical protein
MRMSRFLLAVTAAALAVGCGAGADLKSGPQPGQTVPTFNPLNVTGPDAGEKQCQV